MRSAVSISLGTAATVLGLVTVIAAQQPAAPKAATAAAPAVAKPAGAAPAAKAVSAHPATPAADYNALVQKYCVGCHNDRNKDRAGSLTLASFDMTKIGQHADVAERVIRKMQASMMPPPGMRSSPT